MENINRLLNDIAKLYFIAVNIVILCIKIDD